MKNNSLYRRILLKLSGETLLGSQPFGINQEACLQAAKNLSLFHKAGIELGVVIGGGNIFRGVEIKKMGMARTPADHLGMLATMMNGIALQQALISINIPVCVMSALECPKAVNPYQWEIALKHIKEGTIVIFVGGTGNPYFTTDTAAAMRASEMGAEALLKATKVDGIYNCDPAKDSNAIKYDEISYSQFLADQLQVMDASAVALCDNNNIPIFIFNMHRLSKETPDEILNQTNKGTWIRR